MKIPIFASNKSQRAKKDARNVVSCIFLSALLLFCFCYGKHRNGCRYSTREGAYDNG